ncbi:restriction endonuclease [Lentzea aerocolonigenes]|uniref:restriction endonuclease n=1 Tax=Lentzea aerocolonigenes TaxID=68170 RepID=UPI00138E4D5F
MRQFSTDHLTETQFEKYCVDLLKAMGFVNVRWRKGTGLSSSPSDQGRDIECEFVRTEIDNAVYVERWFVECKHYKQGVPPTKIAGALAWAEAESPDVLLLVASNFFSNPAKEHLEKYKANNRPRFRIKTWELPDLEAASKGKPLLLSNMVWRKSSTS